MNKLFMTRGNTAVSHQQVKTSKTTQPKLVRRPGHRVRVGPMALYGTAICLAVVIALLYLSQYALMAHLNLHINNLRGKVATLERENRNLQHEAACLASLDRVERIARNDLGMVPFGEIRYLPGLKSDVEIDTEVVESEDENAFLKFAKWIRPKIALAEGTGH